MHPLEPSIVELLTPRGEPRQKAVVVALNRSARDAEQPLHADLRFPLATRQVIGVVQVDVPHRRIARAALCAARQPSLVTVGSGAGA